MRRCSSTLLSLSVLCGVIYSSLCCVVRNVGGVGGGGGRDRVG